MSTSYGVGNGSSNRPSYDEADPLDGMPPQPILRNAVPNALSMPRPSAASAAAVAMTGTGKIQSTIIKMKQLEDLVHQIVQDLPGLANVAEPFIVQMRDMGAAALASQAEGGLGSAADGTNVPAPMAGGGALPAAGGPMMPPPPPPM